MSRVSHAGRVLSCIFLLSGLNVSYQAQADQSGFMSGFSLNTLNIEVTSMYERQYAEVIRQQYDFSCGAAAVASLLTYHYDRPTSEETVFRYMYEKGDVEKINRDGFSLLDMKGYLSSVGLRGDGFQAPLEKLKQSGLPGIVLINQDGFAHFVVIKGFRDDSALVADPAVGIRQIAMEQLSSLYQGVLFVLRDEPDLAKRTAANTDAWDAIVTAPEPAPDIWEHTAQFTASLIQPGDF